MYPRTALISGASSGIGEAFADVFARQGFDLVIVARREDRLRGVADRIAGQYGRQVHVMVSDLADRGAVEALCAAVVQRGIRIDALVNNAGYGLAGGYSRSTWMQHDAFLQVMVVAVAELTYRLLPGMVERGYGRIINVASLAGLVPPTAGHTLYAASKAFVIRFSQSLAHEVRESGVHVTALCPGFTLSEFHDVNGMRAQVSKLPAFMWMDAATVARLGFDAVEAGTSVFVPGRLNAALATLSQILPSRLVSAVNHRLSKSYRKI